MNRPTESLPKYRYIVASLGGFGDYYQTALAMAERQRLTALITDFYFPDVIALRRHLPKPVREFIKLRHIPGLPSRLVSSSPTGAAAARLAARVGRQTQSLNISVGRRAAKTVLSESCGAIVLYSHWPGFIQAFDRSQSSSPVFVVQYHPLIAQVRTAVSRDRQATGLRDGVEVEERSSDEEIANYEAMVRRADGVIAASSFVREGLIEAGVSPQLIRVVPFGGVPHDPRFASEEQVSALPITNRPSNGPVRVLWVGSVVYRKGPHHLAEAMRRVRQGKVTLTVVSRANTMPSPFVGVPGVRCLGAVSPYDLARLYATHDLFVLPSVAEGFGLVIAEALGKGLPVLATTATGAPDVVTDGVDGIIVPPGDVDALALAMERLADDRETLASLQRGAMRNALRRTWRQYRLNFAEAIVSLEESFLG